MNARQGKTPKTTPANPTTPRKRLAQQPAHSPIVNRPDTFPAFLMARTVVGLFNHAAEARQAFEQLLALGFRRVSLQLATSDTLRAQHLPTTAEPPTEPPTEPLGAGFIRFFTDLFVGNENADAAQAHAAATHPDSAVLTVRAATEDEATRARQTLDQHGAIDVYKQAFPAAPGPADDIVDLEGRLGRVRDDDELDANGLTTH